jgi:hypothetical protein
VSPLLSKYALWTQPFNFCRSDIPSSITCLYTLLLHPRNSTCMWPMSPSFTNRTIAGCCPVTGSVACLSCNRVSVAFLTLYIRTWCSYHLHVPLWFNHLFAIQLSITLHRDANAIYGLVPGHRHRNHIVSFIAGSNHTA